MADWPYNTPRWQTLRAQTLRQEPLCRLCQANGSLTAANTVDHITPISQGGEPFDRANLQPLCASCHSRHKQRQDMGGTLPGCTSEGLPTDPLHPWNLENVAVETVQ